VQVSASGLYTYPDAVAVSGERQFLDERRDTLLNPTLIIEVLSESTEADDRGRKFEHYRTLPSLREYLMIHPNASQPSYSHVKRASGY
jgi:Uma2 family endonuclease